MARNRNKAVAGGEKITVVESGASRQPKAGRTQSASVFYKPARAGRSESDQLHILVPKLYVGTQLAESINVSLGQSIHQNAENQGIVITGVKVGKFDPSRFSGGPRGKGVGQIVVSVRRDPELTTDDVIHAMKNSVFKQSQIQFGEVQYVTRSADLPGDPTSPRPRPRPK